MSDIGSYPFAKPDLAHEIAEIRQYTKDHPVLADCHHFCFDFRLGDFDRADFIVMGLNPGETDDDRAAARGPVEESSLVDYRAGQDSASRARWFKTCRTVLRSESIALTELCFWSSPNISALEARIGPLASSPHLRFCRKLNERLISFHKPAAVVLPGLGLMPLTAKLYDLKFVSALPDDKGRRLIEHYERDGVPWVFTKHWSGSFGFTNGNKEQIADYLHELAGRTPP